MMRALENKSFLEVLPHVALSKEVRATHNARLRALNLSAIRAGLFIPEICDYRAQRPIPLRYRSLHYPIYQSLEEDEENG